MDKGGLRAGAGRKRTLSKIQRRYVASMYKSAKLARINNNTYDRSKFELSMDELGQLRKEQSIQNVDQNGKVYVPEYNGIPATDVAMSIADGSRDELECNDDCARGCIHFRINASAEAMKEVTELLDKKKNYFTPKLRSWSKEDIMKSVASEASEWFGIPVSISQVDKAIREFPNGLN